jgi:hypothetical protein
MLGDLVIHAGAGFRDIGETDAERHQEGDTCSIPMPFDPARTTKLMVNQQVAPLDGSVEAPRRSH